MIIVPDRTWEVAASLIAEYPHLRVLRREGEKGLCLGSGEGWQVARGRHPWGHRCRFTAPPGSVIKIIRANQSRSRSAPWLVAMWKGVESANGV
jgi:hypothetical protein